MSAKSQEIVAKIQAMPPAERLRFAALLIEQGKYDLARPIVKDIGYELDAVALMRGKS